MDNNIVTYSRSMTIDLSRICAYACAYCDYPVNKLDQTNYELLVPYSTIRMCALAKKKGVKEVNFVSGERPDGFSAVRARLDLWGFSSFIEYVYTICELVFLEGLIPTIDVGYISSDEMLVIRRMAASITVMLDTVDERILAKYAPGKTLNSRLEIIKNASEGKVPVTTGIIVGLGESLKSRKDAFEVIKHAHLKYGNIQNCVIQNFIPNDRTENLGLTQGPTQSEMLETVELARKILPPDVQITVPAVCNANIMPFIKQGVRDIGRFDINAEKDSGLDHNKLLANIEKQLKKEDLGLQRRLPIFSKYIAENWYSRKLAQILDRYKALLTSEEAREEEDKAELEEKARKVKKLKKEKKVSKLAKKSSKKSKSKK